MLILLGVIGMSFTGSVRTQMQAMRASRGRVEALWAARAGIERARTGMSRRSPDVVEGSTAP
jgi:type II secretory pathway component PulK